MAKSIGRIASSGHGDLANRRITCWDGPRLKIELEMDRHGIAQVAVGRQLRDSLHSLVKNKAMPYAVSISPYDPQGEPPHYRDSFRIRLGFETIAGMRRTAVRLFNISEHSVRVEWVNKKNNRVLTRTLAYLNHESILANLMQEAERLEKRGPRRQGKFDEAQHPRGARGRFVGKTGEQRDAENMARTQEEADRNYRYHEDAERSAAQVRRSTDPATRRKKRKPGPSTPPSGPSGLGMLYSSDWGHNN